MELHFEPITPENRKQAEALRVADGQETYIETVVQCLGEADRKKVWRPIGIFDGEVPVGFAMYGYFFWEYFPIGRLWLDRFMIDRNFQGRGYGRSALEGLLKRLTGLYPRKKIYLSVISGNEAAVRLYRQFGFEFNGEKDIHGEDVMVRPA